MSIPIISELSRFSEWNSAKRFLNMSATDFLRRYKDRNNLAKTFIVSRIFCKSSVFFLIIDKKGGEKLAIQK